MIYFHGIIHYPLHKSIGFGSYFPVDSDSFAGMHYPASFE